MHIVFSEKCLEYWYPGHPESPDRVYQAYKLLRDRGFRFVNAEPCSDDELLLVHSREFVERIKSEIFYDPDTPSLPGIYEYAKLAAGAAIRSMEIALGGEKTFSLMRPPGHHAGINGRALGASTLGFCYFNNIAIACKKALRKVSRVAIIDIDAHHGNGTQEIFFGNPNVLFVSLHRYGGVYPGTGERSVGNCLNYPLTYAVGDAEYLRTLGSALKEVEKFDPDLIAVSAGFDTHKNDPVCSLGLSFESYVMIGQMIAELGRKTFAVLEGGYGRDFPKCILNFLEGLEQI
ncbi:MAG: histone deacetylase [Candidatus Bathyarchaeia archaeon]|nr:histone deacetylase [Candidatus Bathyarchaeota archaeon]